MRSKLFVPASRPELFLKALASAADALSFDLEDAVAEDRKAEARELLAKALTSAEMVASKKTVIVRVNALTTPHFANDVAAVVGPRLDFLNVPMVESPDEIRSVVSILERIETERNLARPIPIIANIESPRGLRRAAEIAAAHPRVVGLQLGFADLFEPLGMDRTNATAVQHVQLAVRLAAGEAGIWAYDAAYGAVKDADGFGAEAVAARRLGFRGKTCIHPSQIAIANEVFQPSEKEIAFARKVLAAADDAARNGVGVFTVDGQMIDEPFIQRARAVVAMAP